MDVEFLHHIDILYVNFISALVNSSPSFFLSTPQDFVLVIISKWIQQHLLLGGVFILTDWVIKSTNRHSVCRKPSFALKWVITIMRKKPEEIKEAELGISSSPPVAVWLTHIHRSCARPCPVFQHSLFVRSEWISDQRPTGSSVCENPAPEGGK